MLLDSRAAARREGSDRFANIGMTKLKASRRGQDKRGRRRSATIQFPLVNFHRIMWAKSGKLWQHVANILQHVATCADLKQTLQHVGELWPFCENPVCPDPCASRRTKAPPGARQRGMSKRGVRGATWGKMCALKTKYGKV